MSWLSDFFLGSEGEIDWDELARMVELNAEINKTDRTGIFSGWEWERDAEGNPLDRQVQTINPAFQGAVDRLGFNAGKPADPYTSPSGFNEMLDRKMANQMDRMGMDTAPYEGWYQDYYSEQPAYVPGANRPGTVETPLDAYIPAAPGEQAPVEDPGYVAPGGPVADPGIDPGLNPDPPTFEIEPSPGAGAPPSEPEWEPSVQPGGGLPPDYYTKKGRIRRRYDPTNKFYIGDEALARYSNWKANEMPVDYYTKKGKVRKKYRDGQYGSDPFVPPTGGDG